MSGAWRIKSRKKMSGPYIKKQERGNLLLIQIIRDNNQHDYVVDFMLDNLIASNKIAKFKRRKGWVTVGITPTRTNKNSSNFRGDDRRAVRNSTFAHHYLRSNP
jgi:hypothetical protein